jgi:hypothetical protein
LEVLQLVTLSPLPRRAITAAAGSSGSSSRSTQAGGARSGMATLLHAASTGNAQPFYGLADPEVRLSGALSDKLNTKINPEERDTSALYASLRTNGAIDSSAPNISPTFLSHTFMPCPWCLMH